LPGNRYLRSSRNSITQRDIDPKTTPVTTFEDVKGERDGGGEGGCSGYVEKSEKGKSAYGDSIKKWEDTATDT
jgi:hypothetical protein